jgi:hypothetical protein
VLVTVFTFLTAFTGGEGGFAFFWARRGERRSVVDMEYWVNRTSLESAKKDFKFFL